MNDNETFTRILDEFQDKLLGTVDIYRPVKNSSNIGSTESEGDDFESEDDVFVSEDDESDTEEIPITELVYDDTLFIPTYDENIYTINEVRTAEEEFHKINQEFDGPGLDTAQGISNYKDVFEYLIGETQEQSRHISTLEYLIENEMEKILLTKMRASSGITPESFIADLDIDEKRFLLDANSPRERKFRALDNYIQSKIREDDYILLNDAVKKIVAHLKSLPQADEFPVGLIETVNNFNDKTQYIGNVPTPNMATFDNFIQAYTDYLNGLIRQKNIIHMISYLINFYMDQNLSDPEDIAFLNEYIADIVKSNTQLSNPITSILGNNIYDINYYDPRDIGDVLALLINDTRQSRWSIFSRNESIDALNERFRELKLNVDQKIKEHTALGFEKSRRTRNKVIRNLRSYYDDGMNDALVRKLVPRRMDISDKEDVVAMLESILDSEILSYSQNKRYTSRPQLSSQEKNTLMEKYTHLGKKVISQAERGAFFKKIRERYKNELDRQRGRSEDEITRIDEIYENYLSFFASIIFLPGKSVTDDEAYSSDKYLKYFQDVLNNNQSDLSLSSYDRSIFVNQLKSLLTDEKEDLSRRYKRIITNVYCGQVSYGNVVDNFKEKIFRIRNEQDDGSDTDINTYNQEPYIKKKDDENIDIHRDRFKDMMYFFSPYSIPGVLLNRFQSALYVTMKDYFSELQIERIMYYNMSVVTKYILQFMLDNDPSRVIFSEFIKTGNFRFLLRKGVFYANVWRGKVVYNYLDTFLKKKFPIDPLLREPDREGFMRITYAITALRRIYGARNLDYSLYASVSPDNVEYLYTMMSNVIELTSAEIARDIYAESNYISYIFKNLVVFGRSNLRYFEGWWKDTPLDDTGTFVFNKILQYKINTLRNKPPISNGGENTYDVLVERMINAFIGSVDQEKINDFRAIKQMETASPKEILDMEYIFCIELLVDHMNRLFIWRFVTEDIYLEYRPIKKRPSNNINIFIDSMEREISKLFDQVYRSVYKYYLDAMFHYFGESVFIHKWPKI